MATFHPVAGLLLIAGAFLLLMAARFGSRDSSSPKVRARSLMTRIERETIGYVEAAVPLARVHAQVSMGALLQSLPKLGRSQGTSTRNRFSSKRVDYVLQDRSNGRIIVLVPLDDRSLDAHPTPRFHKNSRTGSAFFSRKYDGVSRGSVYC